MLILSRAGLVWRDVDSCSDLCFELFPQDLSLICFYLFNLLLVLFCTASFMFRSRVILCMFFFFVALIIEYIVLCHHVALRPSFVALTLHELVLFSVAFLFQLDV